MAEPCDDAADILFGRLDTVPLLGADLHLGNDFAASYDKAVDDRKASNFEKQ